MGLEVYVPEDHGAVDVLETGPDWVEVAPHDYPEDTYPNIWYWFCVRNAGPTAVAPARVTLSGLFAGADRIYQPFWSMSLWSRDGESWERVPPGSQTVHEDRVEFVTDLAPERSVWFAETFPLPWSHCETLMNRLPQISEPGYELEKLHLGQSEEGRPITVARVSDASSKPALVLVGGQHAVEESGKLFCETVLEWLISSRESDEVREILSRYEVFVAPEVNPDGCYCGRMNTNARGVVMDGRDDDSAEMRAQLGLVDEARPAILVNCHGWGQATGKPPHDGWYRWDDEDPLFRHVRQRVPGAATSLDSFLTEDFRLEQHVRTEWGTHVGILEINWNFYQQADGRIVQPTIEDLRARSIEYFRTIAAMPSGL